MIMKIQNSNITFQAGLTSQMHLDIANCNIKKISDVMLKNGIETDFKSNKTVAWCSAKCMEIINFVNKQYGLGLGLPKRIVVEDFSLLNSVDNESPGFVNFVPSKLYMSDDRVTPEKTIFFNEFKRFDYSGGNNYWEQLDKVADLNYEEKITGTDYFLEMFLHEFCHVIHEHNLLRNLGGLKTLQFIEKSLDSNQSFLFQTKNQELLKGICDYASANPFEAVACDLSKRMVKSIDNVTFEPLKNFIKNSPYEKKSFWKKVLTLYKQLTPQEKVLKNSWEGRM